MEKFLASNVRERFCSRQCQRMGDGCKTALKDSGVVYDKHRDEEHFIEDVLCRICGIIRPPLRYDVSHLTGHERLTQVVADLIEEMPTVRHLEASAIGFYASGGQGKTTLGKLMVNHYASACAGRCTLIEFPSNDCNEKEVVRQCKKALQQLTNIGQSDINSIEDFDQCLQQMKKRMSGLNVFVAIDNVWEVCLGFAQRILDVGFSRGSIILVTSRSGQVLLNLLKDRTCVMPLPGVNEDEAHQIFAKSFYRNHASLEMNLEDEDVKNVTKSFQSHSGYHPLTISAVGVSLGRTGGDDWLAAWKVHQRQFAGSGSVADKAIKINFDSIPQSRRDMFLDVSLIYIPVVQEAVFDRSPLFYGESSFKDRFGVDMESHHPGFSDMIVTWLSALYMGEKDKNEISMALMQLAYDGLLEFENLEVHVHDLYRELATREAAGCPRFMLSDNKLFQGINHAEVERIVCGIESGFVPTYIKEPNLPKLQVLVVPSCPEWRLVHMPQLRVLKLKIRDCASEEWVDWRSMPELSWLDLKIRRESSFDCFQIGRDISWMRHLCVLELEGCGEIFTMSSNGDGSIADSERLCLDGLVNLQFLFIGNVERLYEISGLDSLINLKHMVLQHLPCLLKVGNFSSCSVQLRVLTIELCYNLREVAGLANVPSLKLLTLCTSNSIVLPSDCESLKSLSLGQLNAMPDLRAMRALMGLELYFTKEANVRVVMHGLLELFRLAISGGRVDEIGASEDGLPRLRLLDIIGSENELLDFSILRNLANLEELTICGCDALEEIDWSSLNDLTNLTSLDIRLCKKLEHVKGEPSRLNHTLRLLTICECPNLQKIEGLALLSQCTIDVHQLETKISP